MYEANEKFKNSVFNALFSDPDLLRELYGALGGKTLPPDVPVLINTLENVLFMGKYNDISFEIGGKMVVLVEHQSSINPNMALRCLLYYSRIIEKKISGQNLYSTKKLSIPWPEFYVLYNGTDEFPDEATVKLSDLFISPNELGLPDDLKPLLDLDVKVFNINEGRNTEVLSRCRKLSEYSVLMGKVRDYKNELGNLEEAIKKAITYCHRCDILTEFLEIHGSEVLNMILTEWNTEDAIAFAREEGKEMGREEEREKGEKKLFQEKLTIAKNLLAKGSTPEFTSDITGLSTEEIAKL